MKALEQQFLDSQLGSETLVVERTTYSGRLVIPNSVELDKLKEAGYEEFTGTPFGVRVRKYLTSDIEKLSIKNTTKEQQDFQLFCKKYPHQKMMLHIQVPYGIILNDENIKHIETVQEIDDTPFFLGYDKGYTESAKDYIERQTKYRSKYDQKTVLPVLDLDEINPGELAKKAQEIVKAGFKATVVIYRGEFKGWYAVMPTLKRAGLFVICLGVTPRYTTAKPEASFLIVPFIYGVNAVCHGYPWAPGGKPKPKHLNKSWIYLMDRSLLTGNETKDYALCRVRAIDTSNESCRNVMAGKSMSEIVLTIEGFGYFAKRAGILDEGRAKSKGLSAFF